MADTIPQPNHNDISNAQITVKNMVSRSGLNSDDPGVQRLVDDTVAVLAQQTAEIRWLRNIVHEPNIK